MDRLQLEQNSAARLVNASRKHDHSTPILRSLRWLPVRYRIIFIILLHEKFLQFDWLRAVVFQLNLKYLHVKITKPLREVV